MSLLHRILLGILSVVLVASGYLWLALDTLAALSQIVQGILGAFVSVESEWTRRHKYAVMGAFFVLTAVGTTATIRGSRLSASETARAQEKLSGSLQQIATTTKESVRLQSQVAEMQRLNTAMQERLLASGVTVAGLTRTAIAAMTGGDSYAYLKPRVTELPNGACIALDLRHEGRYPLFDMRIDIYDDPMDPDVDRMYFRYAKKIRVQTVLPSKYDDIPLELNARSPGECRGITVRSSWFSNFYFHAVFSARNGTWDQTLFATGRRGKWMFATRTTRVEGHRTVVLREYIDPSCPKDRADQIRGDMRW